MSLSTNLGVSSHPLHELKTLCRSAGTLSPANHPVYRLIALLTVEQAPIDEYTIPLSRTETLIPGSDLTLLTWGTPVYHCESAIQLLNSRLSHRSSLSPCAIVMGHRGCCWGVRRTKRFVVVHEAGMTGGVGGEIAMEVSKRAFLRLEAPVRGIAGWSVSAALQFEKFNMPDQIRISDGIVEMLSYRGS
ncbi:TK C-terminal domain-like protein [Rhizopogon vinicolor AM-OR11-026]|uniref:TK C-terminal domain-like protein n=1 Tax=Rhizopogon vinicolor AM-OR11-026 TaxID=1314800 RepID=A0A1B7N748_9AGAM|nr:TK C-terminal domain-like protein [Rhizopogon vinicolor AM-OR11-026]